MNPICEEDLVTLSLSMKGVMGSPSSFSRSLCWKYSSRRQSSHGSATSAGRTSLLMSQHLISITFSCEGEEGGGRECEGWEGVICEGEGVIGGGCKYRGVV